MVQHLEGKDCFARLLMFQLTWKDFSIWLHFSNPQINAGTTTQLLLSFFDMEGVVHYGIAGNANPSLNVGDVAVPQYWSHTALWNWQDLELEGCLDSTTCLSTTPKVYTVDNGTSASIYLDNAAYRGFIYRKFDISLVDMESASMALLCFQQTVPFIANWALSSPAVALPATTRLTPSSPSLAANNSIAVVLAFVNNF